MSEELLPCPFCGEESKLEIFEHGKGTEDYDCYVQCQCCTTTGPSINDWRGDAIAAWNRRAPLPTEQSSAHRPAVARSDKPQDGFVLPPTRGTDSQHDASPSATDEIDFLTEWLQFIGEPVGVECCGRGYGDGECCNNPVPVTVTLPELEKAMNERLNVLVAKLPASGFREGRNAQPDSNQENHATEAVRADRAAQKGMK